MKYDEIAPDCTYIGTGADGPKNGCGIGPAGDDDTGDSSGGHDACVTAARYCDCGRVFIIGYEIDTVVVGEITNWLESIIVDGNVAIG